MPNTLKTNALPAAIALAGLMLSACASAPERGDRRGPPQDRGGTYQGGIIARPIAVLLTGMDVDGDYRTSSGELSDGIGKEWRALSEDNRPVSALALGGWAELALGSREALPNHLSFDVDMNGAITSLEFSDRLRAEYRQLDADQDGFVTRAEMVKRLPAPEIKGEQGGGQGRGQGGGDRPPRR